MPSYYEMLNVSTTATAIEVEAAYEQQYNRWRRLVTHHDPDMANKANQALLWLEKARSTLMDPAKREQYDAGIGLRGPVGGIADPSAAPRPTPAAPPRPRTGAVPQSTPAAAQRVDAWGCPKCQMPNPVGTRFCERCGETLAQECPNCASWVKAQAIFCPECGTNVPELRQQQEQERLRQEKLRAQIEALQGQISQLEDRKKPQPVQSEWANWGQLMLVIIGGLGIFIGPFLFYELVDGMFWGIPVVILCLVIGGASFWAMIAWSNRNKAKAKPVFEHNTRIDERIRQINQEVQALNEQLETKR